MMGQFPYRTITMSRESISKAIAIFWANKKNPLLFCPSRNFLSGCSIGKVFVKTWYVPIRTPSAPSSASQYNNLPAIYPDIYLTLIQSNYRKWRKVFRQRGFLTEQEKLCFCYFLAASYRALLQQVLQNLLAKLYDCFWLWVVEGFGDFQQCLLAVDGV